MTWSMPSTYCGISSDFIMERTTWSSLNRIIMGPVSPFYNERILLHLVPALLLILRSVTAVLLRKPSVNRDKDRSKFHHIVWIVPAVHSLPLLNSCLASSQDLLIAYLLEIRDKVVWIVIPQDQIDNVNSSIKWKVPFYYYIVYFSIYTL